MIIWGGTISGVETFTGARYNPGTDSWIATSTIGSIALGGGHTAVWTGTLMIVWGGRVGCPLNCHTVNLGSRYDPLADTWAATSVGANLPGPSDVHKAIWTGSGMVIWFGTGGRYNPVTDTWRTVTTANAPANFGNFSSAAWTGTELIEWGGDFNFISQWTGGRYDPAADTWLQTAVGGSAPTARAGHAAVWTGNEMIIWSGSTSNGCCPTNYSYHNDGSRYSPASNTWKTVSTGTNVPSARTSVNAVWTGNSMIVWGGSFNYTDLNTGGIYTVPPDPLSPTASANAAAPNRIDVSWTDSATATTSSYTISRATISGGPYTPMTTVPDSSPGVGGSSGYVYQDTTVSGGTIYYYIITVNDSQNCTSSVSNQAKTTATGVCTFLPNFSGAGSATNKATSNCAVQLSWPSGSSNCGGSLSYSVYRSTTSGFTPSLVTRIVSGITGTSYLDGSGLASGTPYFYVVRAVDSAGNIDPNAKQVTATPAGPSVVFNDDGGDSGTAQMAMSSPWSLALSGGWGSARVYQTGAYPANACGALTSPLINLPPGMTLRFGAKYDTELDFDKGIVEISMDAGATWTKLTGINYPGNSTATGDGCGLGATGPAFTGTNLTYAYYGSVLTGYSGPNCKIRFRFASDSSSNGAGWWIDSITIYSDTPSTCATCNPTPMSTLTQAKSSADLVENWSAVPGAASYSVYRNSTPGNPAGWAASASALTGTGWIDANQLNNSISQFYSITDVNNCGLESPK